MAGWELIETAPRDGTQVLLFSPDAVNGWAMLGHWAEFVDERNKVIDQCWVDTWADTEIDAEPTHWQPLPAPPEGT